VLSIDKLRLGTLMRGEVEALERDIFSIMRPLIMFKLPSYYKRQIHFGISRDSKSVKPEGRVGEYVRKVEIAAIKKIQSSQQDTRV